MKRRRKVIVEIATSADGYIARSDGDVAWLDRPQPKDHYGMGGFMKTIDTILWGRKTCDIALDFQKQADKMGMSKADLAVAILDAIARDNLYDAVMDHDIGPIRHKASPVSRRSKIALD